MSTPNDNAPVDPQSATQGRPRPDPVENLIIGAEPRSAPQARYRRRSSASTPPTRPPRIRALPAALVSAAVTALVVGAGLLTFAAQRESEWTLCASQDRNAAEAEQLRALTQAEVDAYTLAEPAELASILAPSFTLTSPTGEVLTRSELIGAITNGDLDFHLFRIHTDQAPLDIQIACTSAVVTYRSSIDVTTSATRYQHDAQHTDVWIKHEGEWQHLRAHTTAIGGFPPTRR